MIGYVIRDKNKNSFKIVFLSMPLPSWYIALYKMQMLREKN